MTSMSADTFTYTLRRPLDVGGKRIETVTVRRPLVRDLIAADRQPGETGGTAALVAICAGIPLADFGGLDAADYRAILRQGYRLGFFGDPEEVSES